MTESLRETLSQAHGILEMLGLDDHTYTHLSVRLPEEDAFLLTPFGLCFEEVSPASLLKVGYDGTLYEGASTLMNPTGYVIHHSIYQVSSSICSVFHLHTAETVAVSALANGLMPLSQWALHFHERVSYCDYDSLALQANQGKLLASTLKGNLLFLRHHGIITTGKTIHEALFYAYHLQRACETQCKLLAMNQEVLSIPSAVCLQTVKDLLSFEKDLGRRDWDAWVRRLKRYRHQKRL